MKRLLLVLLLLSGCATTKPLFYAASVQPEPVVRTLTVCYGDYEEAEVKEVVGQAIVDFASRTRIIADVREWRRMEWQSREFYAMADQALQLYPDRIIPTEWVLLIYRKTPLEYVLRYAIGVVHGPPRLAGIGPLCVSLKAI